MNKHDNKRAEANKLYQDLYAQIEAVKYSPSGGIDRVIETLSTLRARTIELFSYSDYHNVLCEFCDAKKREVISECLYDLLLRKDRLKQTAEKQIEYVITSIFSYIFPDFNLEQALIKRYGPNYNTVIEQPNQQGTVFISWYKPKSAGGGFSVGIIENRLLSKCNLSNITFEGKAGKMPVLDCYFIKDEKVDLHNIIMLKSKDIFIVIFQHNKVDEVTFYTTELEATQAFEKLKEQLIDEN